MAEAFAAAASAAGIVSLGLEVCEGLSTYIDAFRNRSEDISAIRRQVGGFQSSLAILRDALPDVDVKHQTAGNTAQAALDSCQLELNDLKAFMETLGDPKTLSHTFESSLTHAKKKLAFPFQKKKLEALQKRLMIVNTSLDVATRAIGLKIISSIENLAAGAQAQLSYISTISAANSSTSTSIKAALDTAIPQTNQALVNINDDLGLVKASLPEIKQDLDSMNSTMCALAVTVENTSPSPELLRGIIRAADILKNLAERKESDPPEVLGALSQQRALYRLVASPAQLEQVVTLSCENDGVGHEFTFDQRDKPNLGFERTPGYHSGSNHITNRYTSICICRPRHKTNWSRATLGSLSFSMLCDRRWKHLPECKFANSATVSTSGCMGLSYSGVRWHISRAVDVSISLSTGSGGLSISPNITIRPVIDEEKAPVFQTLRLMESAYYDRRRSEKFTLQFLKVAIQRIMRRYKSRKSSPYEVNSYGSSALHIWGEVALYANHSWGTSAVENYVMVTQSLIEAGVPVSLCEDSGWSAGNYMLKIRPDIIFELTRLMCILCEEEPEPKAWDTSFCLGNGMYTVSHRLHSTVEGIEILRCGPLSAAVILRNETRVKSLITSYPSTIYEKNVCNQTPFHFASDKPAILEVLLSAANRQELDCQDDNGNHALDYALRYSSKICGNGNSWIACSECPCVESIKIFLNYHWHYRTDCIEYCASERSHIARLRLINYLVARRAELNTLGQKFFVINLPFLRSQGRPNN
ncbi:hypothetical protein F5Y08DRAFT_314987 [Xylaria arbuscula]|nr:hypothetical protein F5Y08DRAFT_314987 [Xylaria arbuscula]